MNRDLSHVLACPACFGDLALDVQRANEGEVETGVLQCCACAAHYPVVRFVPCFVPADAYASSFGFQWNRFQRTQLDSSTGQPITRDRFFGQSAWHAPEMADHWTLDIACGAGRFTEVALGTGARVVAVDYMLAPAHDHPQSVATLRSWFEEAGLEDIEVFRRGLVVGRGVRRMQAPCRGNG